MIANPTGLEHTWVNYTFANNYQELDSEQPIIEGFNSSEQDLEISQRTTRLPTRVVCKVY